MKRFALLLFLLAACNRGEKRAARTQTSGDHDRGKAAIERYGCPACHKIPGVPGPKGMVGPPLDHLAARAYIAGKFANNP